VGRHEATHHDVAPRLVFEVRRKHTESVREIELLQRVVACDALVEHPTSQTALLRIHDRGISQHETDELRVEPALHLSHFMSQRRRGRAHFQQAFEHVVLDQLSRFAQVGDDRSAASTGPNLCVLQQTLQRGLVLARRQASPKPLLERYGKHALSHKQIVDWRCQHAMRDANALHWRACAAPSG